MFCMNRFGLLLAGLALISCTRQASVASPPAARAPGEVRGLYVSGFETSLFRPCNGSFTDSDQVVFDSAAATVINANRHLAVAARSGAGTYDVLYVGWVVRDLPAPPPPPEGHVRITNAPKLAVVRVLEVRAPQPGECGWSPGGEIKDPAA